MLASAGILAVELEPNAPGGWIDAALWPANGQPLTYVGQELPYGLGVVVGVEVIWILCATKRFHLDSRPAELPS